LDSTVDGCELQITGAPIDPESWYSSRIDLMDAGTLTIIAGESVLTLEPRPLPGLLPFLGGYMYGTDQSERPLYVRGGLWEIESGGGDRVNAFAVTLALPDPISISYIDRVAVGSAESLDVDFQNGLLLLWNPTVAGEMVSIILDGDNQSAILSCHALDDGAFRISGEAIEALRRAEGLEAVRLTLRRAVVAPLELPGFDQANAVAITEHSLLLY
jgi:hypothetical protein